MKEIKVLLFDVGGVLVKLGGMHTMFEWTQFRYSEEELMDRWLRSQTVRSFESGGCSFDLFSDGVVREFQLPVSSEAFKQEFIKWPSGLFEGTKECLKTLKKHYRLATLSNTNEIHWPHIMNDLGLDDCFHLHFPSYQTGLLKPDEGAFQNAIHSLDVDPGSILFLDDSLRNIQSAARHRLQTEQVKGIDQVRQRLIKRNLLTAA